MKLSFLILLLFVINSASESADAQGAKSPAATDKQTGPTESKQTDTQQARAQSVPSVVVINNVPAQKEETTPKQESAYWPPIWSNWALFIATVGLAIVALRTLAKIREQAEAATKSVVVTRELVELERPWIMVKPGDPRDNVPGVGYGFEINWTAINVGRTPAFLTELIVTVDTFPSKAVPDYPPYPEAKSFAKFVIPPNGEHGGSVKKILDPTGVGELWQKSCYLVFFGKVKYHSGANEYVTRFCSYWHWEGEGDDKVRLSEPVGPPNWVEYT